MTTDTDEMELLTVRQVAGIFQVAEETIRDWIAAGKLKATKPGGKRWRISRAECTRYAQEQYGA